MSEITTKRIKDWANTALSKAVFALGNFLPLDGPNGTFKVPAEFFETLQNLAVESDSEYLFAIVDAADTLLFGIKKDGSVDWAKGIPEQIKQPLEQIIAALPTKVDAVAGKGLIDSLFSNSVKFESNEEYIFCITDTNDKFLFGIRRNGQVNWAKNPNQIEYISKTIKIKKDDQYIFALLDSHDNILLSLNNKGELFWNKGLSPELEKIVEYVNSIKKSLYNESNVYLFAIVDKDNRIILSVDKNGVVKSDSLTIQINDIITQRTSNLSTKSYVDNSVNNEKSRAEEAEENLQEQINNLNPTTVIGGTNNPDNLYLTSLDDKITLKDIQQSLYNKSIVYVRDFLTDLTLQNAIYVINFEQNLNGSEITIPSNSILYFVNGLVYNGTIIGSDTDIKFCSPCFKNISFGGTWKVKNISSKMLADADLDNKLRFVNSLQNDNFYNEIEICEGIYYFNPTDGNNNLIELTSNTKLIINGRIETKSHELQISNVVYSSGSDNIEICGCGTILGDIDSHNYIGQGTHEWNHLINVTNVSNLRIHGLTLSKATGDGIYVLSNNADIFNLNLNNCGRQGISVMGGSNTMIRNCIIENVKRVLPKGGIDIEPNEGTADNVFIYNVVIKNCDGGLLIHKSNNVRVCNLIMDATDKILYIINSNDIILDSVKIKTESVDNTSINFGIQSDMYNNNLVLRHLNVESTQNVGSLDLSRALIGLDTKFNNENILATNPLEGSTAFVSGHLNLFDGYNWNLIN